MMIIAGRLTVWPSNCNLLIEFSLTDTDFPDPLQLLFKVFFAENGAVILQTFIIHRKTFDGKFLHNVGRPPSKKYSPLRIYLVTNRNDSRKIVVFGWIVFTILGSHPKISNN